MSGQKGTGMDKTEKAHVNMYFEKNKKGQLFLVDDFLPDCLDGAQCDAALMDIFGNQRIYPIFQQKAYQYGEYSEYMKRHGCACCSLTTLLAAYRPECSSLRPEQTIAKVERKYFSETDWERNYKKHIARQMPVSLYGISRILTQYEIAHRYIGSFNEKHALEDIKRHLFSGRPVVVETSRIKRKNGRIIKLSDKRFAGSYHTMILLGMNREGQVIFTDSATREWAGKRQRLKWAELDDMLSYMFPQKCTKDTHVYFSRRKNTGGYILLDE